VTQTESTWTEVSRSRERRKCDEHALVLQAVGIQHGRMSAEGAWVLLVATTDRERARLELERYDRENVNWPPREARDVPISRGVYAAVVYAALMGLVFLWQHTKPLGIDWTAAGNSQAALVTGGEWWRTITALSLHVDLTHLVSNIVFGSLFGILLAHAIGVGPAWLATLATGALGNLLNAWIQPADHSSIGASTAIFGALGVQVAYEWRRRHDAGRTKLRRFAPVIGGIALLGWLGAGQTLSIGATTQQNIDVLQQTVSKTDVMAHVTGFATGIAIGAALGAVRGRLVLSTAWQVVLALAAPAILALAWVLALTHTH
jgi:membrane associated rhomboid family serine protease